MTPFDLLAQIEAIRDMLVESRRYMRTHDGSELSVGAVMTVQAVNDLRRIAPEIVGRHRIVHRLIDNLRVGLLELLVDPAVIEGYIDGTRHELACIAGRIEREYRAEHRETIDPSVRGAQ